MQGTFLWHDYETFGTDPRRDRPVQFAAIRTDANFNEIGEPIMLYCRQADDYIPHPEALLVTGITPQDANRQGLCESEFAERIQQAMAEPGTCTLGYNSLRFDDEFSRNLFYRNFIDPYAREWQNGNSRWDLIDIVRATHALRPEGIVWPQSEDGTPSFRLEKLTEANGIEHGQAHDALADVRATIAVARLLKSRQPRLFEHLLGLRSKQAVKRLIDLDQHKPLLHVSGMLPARRGCATLVMPVAMHPTNPNGVIVYDLAQSPDQWLDLDENALRQRVFSDTASLQAQGLERLPLKVVHVNRCPILLPVKAVDEGVAERLGLDRARCEQHWQQLRSVPQLVERVQAVFNAPPAEDHQGDPDLMIYGGGFFSSHDRQQMSEIRACDPELLSTLRLPFQDQRLEEMLFRFRARNWPEFLDSEERERWDEWRWQRMNDSQLSSLTLEGLQQRLMQLGNSGELNESQFFLMQELQAYVESIVPTHLFY